MIYYNYRPHRGSLDESMKEAKSFSSLDSFREHVGLSADVRLYGDDHRLESPTFLVVNEANRPLGFLWFSVEPLKASVA